MIYTYPAVFCKESDGYTVLFPDFENATCGDSFDEAMYMAMDLLAANIFWAKEDGAAVPPPTAFDAIDLHAYADDLSCDLDALHIVHITCDPEEYIQTCSLKGIRTYVLIPQQLYHEAMDQEIDLSELLQEALASKLYADDPFYSAKNQARLLLSKKQMEETGGTVHDLIEVDDSQEPN